MGTVTMAEMEEYLLNHSKDSLQADFVTSLVEEFRANGELTSGQEKAFKAIAHNLDQKKVREAKEAQRYEVWKSNFTPKMREDAEIMARYFMGAWPPSRSPETQILADPSYIPDQKTYNFMCRSHRAKQVLKQHFAKPKFDNGQLVFPRKSAPAEVLAAIKRGGYVVLPDARPISSPASGSKWYSILPVGEIKVCYAQERWLKRATGKNRR